MRCVIIGGGEIKNFTYARSLIGEDDTVIAADRGYARCQQMNIKPSLLLGDFDSYVGEISVDFRFMEYPFE